MVDLSFVSLALASETTGENISMLETEKNFRLVCESLECVDLHRGQYDRPMHVTRPCLAGANSSVEDPITGVIVNWSALRALSKIDFSGRKKHFHIGSPQNPQVHRRVE